MKELKGYLHLYLGCEALIEGYTNREHPFNYRGIINYQLLLESGQHYSSVKAIKPILRPLSDMTEEEARECGNLVYDFSGEPVFDKWGWKDFACLLASEQFLFLISKHFDLFGLIESGLAVNAAKLQTVNE